MDSVVGSLIEIGIMAVVGLIGAIFVRRDFRVGWFLAALAMAVLYNALLTRGFWFIPDPLPDLHWNWTGKGLATVGTLAIMSLPAFGWRRCGLTLHQGRDWRWPLAVVVVLSISLLFLAIYYADSPDDAETIAFQWTMPGIDEELYYRGALLLALNEAFRSKARVLGANIGFGGLLSTFAFGLAHAISYKAGVIEFEPTLFAVTGGPALLLLWLRERTGSVLMPIVAHNVANGIFTLF